MNENGSSNGRATVVVGVDGSAGSLGDTDDAEVERAIVQGPAAQVLIDAVSDHDLLVVGSRAHGGFGGLLLGSVGRQCAQHAPCPVVIVRTATATTAHKEQPWTSA